MKMFRYIALLAILVGAASCVQTDIDTPVINRDGQIGNDAKSGAWTKR